MRRTIDDVGQPLGLRLRGDACLIERDLGLGAGIGSYDDFSGGPIEHHGLIGELDIVAQRRGSDINETVCHVEVPEQRHVRRRSVYIVQCAVHLSLEDEGIRTFLVKAGGFVEYLPIAILGQHNDPGQDRMIQAVRGASVFDGSGRDDNP